MGVLIDGRKVTQPVDGSAKKSLWTVLNELLQTCSLIRNKTDAVFSASDTWKRRLSAVVSPEFHWESQTSLWECLCDIANVVNCIPRVVDYSVITFDDINKITKEYVLDEET